MKKLLVGLALISFVFVTTVGVNAATVGQQEVIAKTEKKACCTEKKAEKKACCTEKKVEKKACCADKATKKCDDTKKAEAKKETK